MTQVFAGSLRGIPPDSQTRWRTTAIERQQRLNDQIRISPIRVINGDRAQLGIIPSSNALNLARGFLQHKDKVLVSVLFRGRELAHMEEGVRLINQIIEQLQDCGKVESPPKQAGRRIEARLAPK